MFFFFFFFFFFVCVFFFFLPILDSSVCSIRNIVRKNLFADVKTWITCLSWSFLLATDSNSTVLHFDSLNKLDVCINKKCHAVKYKSGQLMRLWYLSNRRPVKAQASLRILVVSPEPSLSRTQSMEVDEGSD